MSRGTTTDVPVTSRIIEHLPAIYRDDRFLADFTAGLDALLAPATGTLDSLHGYVDPALAPPDFVDWLAGWVGMPLDEDWSLERRRSLVTAAVELYGRRGTAHGLRDEVALFTNGEVDVHDPGETITSTVPNPDTGRRSPSAASWGEPSTVRLTVDVSDERSVNWAGLRAAARAAVPAHLVLEIELRERNDRARVDAGSDEGSEE